jgi:hypothetical protein
MTGEVVKSKNLETPWGLMLKSGIKLTTSGSAITTNRKIARLRASLGARFSKRKI